MTEPKIMIETDLLIPLEELPMIALAQDVEIPSVIKTLIRNPEKINAMVKSAMEEELSEENSAVKIKKLKFSYRDSSNITHGIAYFKVRLEGTEKELRTVAGKNNLFLFDWNTFQNIKN